MAGVGTPAAVWLPPPLDTGCTRGGGAALRDRTPAPSGRSPALPTTGATGEPACLLHQVCAECGRMATESDARYCNRCGNPLER